MPDGRRELWIAIEPLLIAQQLLDARDVTDALHLDDDRLPGRRRGTAGRSARCRWGTRGARARSRRGAPPTRAARSCCSSASTPSFSSPGSSPSSILVSWSTSCSVISSVSPLGLVATMVSSRSTIVHGGLIQLSGLYALESECIATEPSALSRTSRTPGARYAPSRPCVGDRAPRDEQPHARSLARRRDAPNAGSASP